MAFKLMQTSLRELFFFSPFRGMSPYHLLILLFLLFLSSTKQQSVQPICGKSGNFTANSTYERNLKGLLSSLTSAVTFSGYLTQRFGEDPDRVYSLVICCGNVNLSECSSCVTSAIQTNPLQVCPKSKQATLWYKFCLFRYSNLPFLDSVDNKDPVLMPETQNATDPALFMKLVYESLKATADWAVYNTDNRFAIGELNKSATHLYTLAQCIPDMSVNNCSRCLRNLFEPLPHALYGRIGARVLGRACCVQYNVSIFYRGAPMVKLTTEADDGRRGKRKIVAVYIAVPLATTTALFVFIIFICIRKKNEESDIDDIDCPVSLLLDQSTLQDATADFHEANKLGEGGFGAVYKGVLPDGQEIAVKRLAANSWQGLRELKNELVLVARLQHKNLVQLLGVCLDKEKMIVYEYVPNGSLDTFLEDTAKREQLYWETRFRIICGIAWGLQYLHDESRLTVVHRDLKSSNILLDANMNPKISDFGLARLFLGQQTHKSTNRIVGTFGYMAPEYVLHGQFSVKSDVFSFGILVLEIITGRKSSSFQDTHHSDLLSWIWKNWINGTIAEVLERSTLGVDWPRSEVLRCIQIGLLCVEENPNDRPNMSMVVLALSRATVSLRSPSRPAFWTGTRSLVDLSADSFEGRFQRELIDPTSSSSSNEPTFLDFETRC